jgi:hypothetical protein
MKFESVDRCRFIHTPLKFSSRKDLPCLAAVETDRRQLSLLVLLKSGRLEVQSSTTWILGLTQNAQRETLTPVRLSRFVKVSYIKVRQTVRERCVGWGYANIHVEYDLRHSPLCCRDTGTLHSGIRIS